MNNRNGRNINPRARPKNKVSGQPKAIKMDATFLDGEQVEGIHLVTDIKMIRQLQTRLDECTKKRTKGQPAGRFPAMWSIVLTTENISLLESEPHFVIPKPYGTRYMLYVDRSGQIFLENNMQSAFRIDKDRSIHFISSDGQRITDTILDGVVTRVSENHPDAGRLTFVIMDAIRCRGVSLTQMNISQRIAYVRNEIMMPRLKDRKVRKDKEAFNLDIVECKESYEAEEFLTERFRDELFKYPLLSIIFVPQNKEYTCGVCSDVYKWRENDVCRGVFLLKIPPEGTDTNLNRKIAELHVAYTKQMGSKFDVITLTDEIRELDGRIVDCVFKDNQWVFDKLRHDRKHANSRISVEESLKVSKNPVTRSRLLASLEIAKQRHS